MAKASFGAGCFWGVEELFRQVPGVTATAVGYEGGAKDHPTYKDVCTGETNHAEVIEIDFDPSLLSYERLLEIFFDMHDPTTLNRQGPDFGTQYRSVVFFHDAEQEREALAMKDRLDRQGRFPRPIVTAIHPAETFWPAEDYHQRYLQKRGLGTCHV